MAQLFSVVVVTHNHEHFVEECLESISNQSLKEIELVVVDDASTDNTNDVVDSWFSRNDKRFVRKVAIRNERRLGVSKTHTIGVSETTGDLVKYIAGDDLLCVNALEEIARFVSHLSEFYFGYGIAVPFYDSLATGTRVFTEEIPRSRFLKDYGSDCKRQFRKLACFDFIPAPSTFFSRRAIEKIGFFDEEFTRTEDWHTWLKFLLNDMNYSVLRKPIALWRRHRQSISTRSSISPDRSFLEDQISVIDKYITPNISRLNCLERYHVFCDRKYRKTMAEGTERTTSRFLSKVYLAIDPLMWRRVVEITTSGSSKEIRLNSG